MTTKTERDRQKLIQDRCQELLSKMLRDEDNKYCVDCDAKGPRWASWNLGIFLCIRCAGIHRNLGVHISKVKSVNLDAWTPEQVTSLQQMGNSRARAVYEANVPDNFRRPQTDSSLEAFIRAKYEHKKYIAREWVPLPIPKVNWDLELEEGKKKKDVRKKTPPITTVDLPPPNPLPKPRSTSGGSAGNTPKSSRAIDAKAKQSTKKSATEDLLGLDAPPEQQTSNDDLFTGFLSAPPPPAVETKPKELAAQSVEAESASAKRTAEEESFFNQATTPAQDKKTPLSKDSILALYSQSSPAPPVTFTAVPGAVYPPQPFPQAVFAPAMSFGGLTNGVLPTQPIVTGASVIPQGGMFGALPVGDVHPQLNVASNPFFSMGAPVQTVPPMFQSLPTVGIGQDHAATNPQSGQDIVNFESPAAQAQMLSTVQNNPSQALSQQMSGLSLGGVPGQVPTVAMGITPGSLGYSHPTGQTLSTNLWQ